MKNKTVFFTHTVALSSLFVLGNAIISLPVKGADEFTFLGYLSSSALGILLCFAVIPFANFLFISNAHKNCNLFKKIAFSLFYTAIAVIALWYSADTFADFVGFVGTVILPDTPKSLIILTFLAAVIFFATRRQEDILKFCLIAFWVILIAVIFFFFATFKNYNFRNIFVFSLPKIETLFENSKPYIKNPVLPSLILPLYITIVFKKKHKTNVFCGLIAGFCVLGICILSALLLFGPQFAGILPYPYASAVSTVTVGRLFTRMDGFSYFIYFAGAITKITVCLFILWNCLKRINYCLRR